MKKLITILMFAGATARVSAATPYTTEPVLVSVQPAGAKYDIKIKNDSDDEVTVYNAGSGGTYRLQKNVTTTIKMEEGDKLYIYENGKKGKLLLTATAALDGKVQLFSKL